MKIALQTLISLDERLDYYPAISTVTNLVDLFIKTVILPFKKPEEVTANPFYAHLQNKSYLRCVTLLIPVLGNILVWLYERQNDPSNLHKKTDILKVVSQNGLLLEKVRNHFKRDPDVVKAAMANNPAALQFSPLRDEASFMMDILKNDGLLLQYAGEEVQKNHACVSIAMKNNPAAYCFASVSSNRGEALDEIRAKDPKALNYADKNYVLSVLKKDGLQLQHAGDEMQKDNDCVSVAIKNNPAAYCFASVSSNRTNILDEIRATHPEALQYADTNYVLGVLRKDGLQIQYAGPGRQKDPECVQAAMSHNPMARQHIPCLADREYLLSAIQSGYLDLFVYAPDEIKTPEFVKQGLKRNGCLLLKLDLASKNDPELIELACQSRIEAIRFAGLDFLQNEEKLLALIQKMPVILGVFPFKEEGHPVIDKAVERDPTLLNYVKSKEYAVYILKRNGLLLVQMNDTLKQNEDVVNAAIAKSPAALQFSPLREDKLFVSYAMRINPASLPYSPLHANADFVLFLFRQFNVKVLDYTDKTLRQDAEFLMKCLTDGEEVHAEAVFRHLTEEHKNNRDYIKRALRANGFVLKCLKEEFQNDAELVSIACEKDPQLICFAGSRLIQQKSFVLQQIKVGNVMALKQASAFQGDREVVLAAVEADGMALEHAVEALREDTEVLDKATAQNPQAIRFASSGFFTAQGGILTLLEKNVAIIPYVTHEAIQQGADHAKVLEKVNALQQEWHEALSGLKGDAQKFKSLPEKFKSNRHFVIAALGVNGYVFMSLSLEFRNEYALLCRACKNTSMIRILKYADEPRKNKAQMQEFVACYPDALMYVDVNVKNDADVISAACSRDRYAIRHAGSTLLNNKAFVLKEIRYNRYLLTYAPQWKEDKEVLLVALQHGKADLSEASPSLRNDLECVTTAIKYSSVQIKHASEEILNNREAIIQLLKIVPSIYYYLPRYQKDAKIIAMVTEAGLDINKKLPI